MNYYDISQPTCNLICRLFPVDGCKAFKIPLKEIAQWLAPNAGLTLNHTWWVEGYMQWSLDGQVCNAAARIGLQKLQLTAAHDHTKAITDVNGTQAWLDKELAAAHPPTLPHDLVVDEAFWQEMGIKSINAPTTLSEFVFQTDITNPLVMEPQAETHKLLEPYSDMDVLADELETAIINSLS